MTSLLKTLGDDWHNPHPYVNLIHTVLPDALVEEVEAIEKRLLYVYEDENYEFKSLKQGKEISTSYKAEIEIAMAKKKLLEEELKKEEDRFNKLIETFKEHEPPEVISEEEKEEEEEEEKEKEEEEGEKQKGKGQKPCRRSLKAEANYKSKLVQGIKTSMASSQVKLRDLHEESEKLTKICTYYNYYANASQYYMSSILALTKNYSETKDVHALIKGIKDTLSYYEMMMRRYVPKEACAGKVKGLCDTHLLPLTVRVYPKDGFKSVLKCCASP